MIHIEPPVRLPDAFKVMARLLVWWQTVTKIGDEHKVARGWGPWNDEGRMWASVDLRPEGSNMSRDRRAAPGNRILTSESISSLLISRIANVGAFARLPSSIHRSSSNPSSVR